MQFRKYQGLGNDFILMDFRSNPLLFPLNETAQFLCHRRFGIGADGLILALPPRNGGDVRMQIINADGTEAEMCGNGVRCFARFLADLDNLPDFSSWRVETAAGLIVPQLIAGQQVAVDMGEPLLNPEAIPTTISEGLPLAEACLEVAGEQFVVAAVGMGNPHAVVQVPKIEAIDLRTMKSWVVTNNDGQFYSATLSHDGKKVAVKKRDKLYHFYVLNAIPDFNDLGASQSILR